MTDEAPTEDVRRIDLMAAGEAPAERDKTPASAAATAPEPIGTGVSMSRLTRSYESILEARAIFYPVSYQFLRELGCGRQGHVFLGLRQGARGCVTEHAIKVFDPRIYRSPEEYWTDMGRIATQISRLQRVQSANIVKRYTYEETYGIGYTQMDAIDGIDLHGLLSARTLERARQRSKREQWQAFMNSVFRIVDGRIALQPGMVVHILRGILRGLECLHGLGFVHYDVKPANVMIDRLGQAKVIDFGRAVINGEELTFLLGSPAYMAPAAHRREPCTPHADMFSVGLVALEMLRGRQLTPSDMQEDELLALKLTLHDRLPDLLPEDVRSNDELVGILQRFVKPDPADRYAAAQDAERGERGLSVVDKQLVSAGLDSEYARDLASFLDALTDTETDRIQDSTDSPTTSVHPTIVAR